MRLATIVAVLPLLASAPASAQGPAAAQAPQIEIELAATGGEPRTELRYDVASVSPQTINMDMNMSLTMGMAGQSFDQAMPTIRMAVSVVDPQVTDEGNLRLGVQMGSASLIDNGTAVDPMLRAELDTALGQMDGFSGTMTIDDRGNLLNSDFDLSSVAPAMRQQLESTMQTMQQSVIPLPEEAVGVGARWSADMSVSMNGMSLSQTASYEVTELGEDYVVIASTISQSAAQQTITLPDMPGASVELMSYDGSGTGAMNVRFDRAMPDGNFTLTSNTAMRTGAEMGMPMDVTMRLSMDVEMTTVPAAEE